MLHEPTKTIGGRLYMQIEASLAQNIVVSMKEIIDQEINFINTDSIIIASTDENRIGNSHGGAEKVVETKNDLVIEFEGQYEGTKKGINIPIYTDSQLVGVIGITGDKKEVEKYGKIIKKMTEILIKDAWLKDVSFKKRENYRIFFEQLISGSKDSENIYHLANILEINMDIPRIVATGSIANFLSISDDQVEDLMNTIQLTLANNKQTIFNLNGSEIRIIFNKSSSEEYMHNQLQSIIKVAKENHGISLYLGVGDSCENMEAFKTSYDQAVTALNWALVNSNSPIEYYTEMDLGILLTNIPYNIERQFIQKIFKNMTADELEEYHEIITIYGQNNGSNYKTADELFIHKNTLQYKLIKLKNITGYDPRKLNDYVILSLAFKLRKIMHAQID